MIKLPRKAKTESGAHGEYFYLGQGRGLKVLKGTFKSIHAAYNSHIFDVAKEESELLSIAESTGIVPRCYGVRIVRRGKSYKVGILMQHLGNKRLRDCNLSENKISEIYDDLYDKLTDVGIDHRDLHKDNIMFYRNKFYAIDFGADYVSVPEHN